MNNSFINQLKLFFYDFRKFDKKIVYIFIFTAVIHSISWYYISRSFFDEVIDPGNTANDLFKFLYWFLGDALLLFLAPLLLISFKFKENLSEYGFSIKNRKFGFQLILIFSILFLPAAWLLMSNEYFALNHPYLPSAKNEVLIFAVYEFGMLLYIFSWEFFWRGFFLFGIEKKFGVYAIFIQMLPFVFLHFGKPFGETIASIFGALILGMLALKTRSFIYGFILHFLMMFMLDVFSVIKFYLSQFNRMAGSFLNIF